MCWAALIGPVMQVAGGAAQSGQDAESLSATADLMGLRAEDAQKRGDIGVEQKRTETAGVVGMQRAIMGASGVDVNTGSAAQVQTDTVGAGTLDAETIRLNAAREVWGFRTEEANLRAQAEAKEAGSLKNWLLPGGWKGARDIMLSGGIKALPTSLGYKTPGMFGGKDNFDQKKVPLQKPR